MNGWQVQTMYERDTEALWERVSAPDPAERQMAQAARSMIDGCQFLNIGTDRLFEAVQALDDTPMADVVSSLANQIEDLRVELVMLAEKYRKGVRE